MKPTQKIKNKFIELVPSIKLTVRQETRSAQKPIILKSKSHTFSQEVMDYVNSLTPPTAKKQIGTGGIRLSETDFDKLIDVIEVTGIRVVEVDVSHGSVQETDTPKFSKSKQIEVNEQVKSRVERGGPYSEDDRALLRQYSGEGGLGKSTINSLDQFFTPRVIAKYMWELAKKHGFKGGKVLEPSCGTGNFFRDAPSGAELFGFEKDLLVSEVAKVLYPKATIYNKYFESAFFDKEREFNKVKESWLPQFDLVIGNPPYGQHKNPYTKLLKPTFGGLEYSFLYHPSQLLKKSGLMIYITASNFLRGRGSEDKELILGQLELVDAYRMPNGTFDTTQVGTDILIFRKK